MIYKRCVRLLQSCHKYVYITRGENNPPYTGGEMDKLTRAYALHLRNAQFAYAGVTVSLTRLGFLLTPGLLSSDRRAYFGL